jgi:hypothetical protein
VNERARIYQYVGPADVKAAARSGGREDDFVCVFCGSDLPALWNVDPFDSAREQTDR